MPSSRLPLALMTLVVVTGCPSFEPIDLVCVDGVCNASDGSVGDAGGRTDAGGDGGSSGSADAGADAGPGPDSGVGDAGGSDGGPSDGGDLDAGTPIDAGFIDAGSAFDAGDSFDAGNSFDAGSPFDGGSAFDAGVDAGTIDAGWPISDGGVFRFSQSGLCLGTLTGRVVQGAGAMSDLLQTSCDAGVRIIEEPHTLGGTRLRLPDGACSIDGTGPLTLECCVDLPGGLPNPNVGLVVWVCNPAIQQSWRVLLGAPGQRSFQSSTDAGNCLEVKSPLVNTPVTTGPCTGAPNQRVQVVP